MTRSAFALACTLALGLPIPAPAQSPELPPDAIPKTSCRTAIAQQNRINLYFHRGVVPQMQRCWSGLRSSGSVSASFVFRRKGDLWLPESSRLRGATLTALDDGPAALRCLDAAMAGTAFPADASDGEATELRAHWSFPVPWLEGLDAAATRLANDGRGGGGSGPGAGDCGGSEGPEMACYDCYYVPIVGWLLCGRACAGYSDCTKTPTGGCQMSFPICITGSAFGNLGGLVRY